MIVKFHELTKQFIVKTESPFEALHIIKITGARNIKPTQTDGLFNSGTIYAIPEISWDELMLLSNDSKVNKYSQQTDTVKSYLPMLDANSVTVTPDSYQLQGAYWLAAKSGRANCDDMGLGKTMQVLLPYQIRKNLGLTNKLFVLCPKIAIDDAWYSEFRKHLGRQPDKDEIFVLNYAQIITDKGFKKIESFLNSDSPEKIMVCLDEIHELAGINSKRFQRLHALLSTRPFHIIGLTGTWIRNKIKSFYGPYVLLTGAVVDYKTFVKKFWSDIGNHPKNIPVLEKIFNNFAIRRKKKDVSSDLPRKNVIPIKLTMGSQQREVYNQYKFAFKYAGFYNKNKTDVLGLIQKQLTAAAHPGVWGEEFPDEWVEKLTALDYLMNEADEEPIVFWSKHPKILEIVCNRYPDKKPVMIPGGLTRDQIRERLNTFANDTECKLICLSLGACNAGLDGLQYKSSTAIFFDLSWKHTEFLQSQDRLHRKGQREIVSLYYLVYRDSIDEKIFDALYAKINNAELVYSGEIDDMVFDWRNMEDIYRML